jgi:chromosome segregation ATPase
MALASVLRKKLALIIGEVRSRDTRIENLISERADVEVRVHTSLHLLQKLTSSSQKDISKLREENVQLQTTLSSTSSKLERINLQLEGSQSSRQELESQNDEIKRRNHDLQRQLDKWQRLEGKGETELESVRKRNMELDTEVKELRDKLKRASENEKLLEREKRRVKQVAGVALQWEVCLNPLSIPFNGLIDFVARSRRREQEARRYSRRT